MRVHLKYAGIVQNSCGIIARQDHVSGSETTIIEVDGVIVML